jgi:ComF family protein
VRGRFLAEGYVDEFSSCYYFQEGGVFQKLVHSLKYNAITAFGVELGTHIGAVLKEKTEVRSIDAIIPIPLHKLKQRERGYNQSESLCQGIAQVLHRPMALSLVKRLKNTVSQTHLSAEERNRNVGDAFEIPDDKRLFVDGKALLIIDDVITTGSTIQAVARVLKEAGAARVIAASAALAKLEGGDS